MECEKSFLRKEILSLYPQFNSFKECYIVKYSFIELFPDFLRSDIPLIQIFNFVIYVSFILFYFLYLFFYFLFTNLSSLFIFLKRLFSFKKVEKYEINNSTSGIYDFEINEENLQNEKIIISEINDIKPFVKKTFVSDFYQKKAVQELDKLLKEKIISPSFLNYIKGSFIIKREIFIIDKIKILETENGYKYCNSVAFFKGYNKPAFKIYVFKEKAKKFFKDFLRELDSFFNFNFN